MKLRYNKIVVNIEHDTPDSKIRKMTKKIAKHLMDAGLAEPGLKTEMRIYVELLAWRAHEIQIENCQ